jgi:hypothetical protein
VSRFSAHDTSYKNEASYSNPKSSNSAALAPEPVQESDLSEPLPNIPWDQYEALMQRNSTLSTECEIQPKELEIWNELIDEGKLGPDPIPQYLAVSVLNRKCCAVFSGRGLSGRACGQCGLGPYHRIEGVEGTLLKQLSIEADYYGNNPLHFLAAYLGENEFWKIRDMIWPGPHVSQCNTFGETFLHILCRNGPRTSNYMENFLLIIEDLYAANFPFSKCDYHGRTILQILFQNSKGYLYDISFLQQIFCIMKPNLSMKDNAGFCVEEYLDGCGDDEYNWELKAVLAPWCRPSYSTLPLVRLQPLARVFAGDLEALFGSWLKDNTKPEYITSINNVGDSPLIAVLKYWDQDSWEDMALRKAAERLIQSGAIIHMRDRNGDTALSIAARRGFRPVLTLLLERGAIVHSRNYLGVGMLKQVDQALALAQRAGNQTLWSRIWSCQMALIDAGAIIDPTDMDEWMSPSRRLALKEEADLARARASASRGGISAISAPTPHPHHNDR